MTIGERIGAGRRGNGDEGIESTCETQFSDGDGDDDERTSTYERRAVGVRACLLLPQRRRGRRRLVVLTDRQICLGVQLNFEKKRSHIDDDWLDGALRERARESRRVRTRCRRGARQQVKVDLSLRRASERHACRLTVGTLSTY